MPAVSVAATILNEARDLPELLRSLATQTLAPAEIVIVDGGSTDGSWELLLAARQQNPALRPIQDRTCNLRHSPGPIARGRNVGIAATTSEIVACADAGCSYGPDWIEQLTASLRSGEAVYALGGSCLDPDHPTVWDYASAPFFGVKLRPDQPSKSCTARSMAFRKVFWNEAGRFPETVFLGEDSLFDRAARRLTKPYFAADAKALYRPRHTLPSAAVQLASYAAADGLVGLRPARLLRHLLRCLAEVTAAVLLRWSVWPALAILLLELHFAFRPDWRDLPRRLPVLAARLIFSVIVPWIVATNQIRGAIRHQPRPNRQNAEPA